MKGVFLFKKQAQATIVFSSVNTRLSRLLPSSYCWSPFQIVLLSCQSFASRAWPVPRASALLSSPEPRLQAMVAAPDGFGDSPFDPVSEDFSSSRPPSRLPPAFRIPTSAYLHHHELHRFSSEDRHAAAGAPDVCALPPPPSPRLRRQRSFSASFSFACCLCGKNGLCGLDLHASALKDCLLCPVSSLTKDGSGQQPAFVAWWQDGWRLLGSRRKANASNTTWADDAVVAEDLYYRPTRWKLFLRKLRSHTRNMNCSKPTPPGFNYDPLSYALNFDDGCWHQSDPHAQGFHPSKLSGPILMESGSFKGSGLDS